MIKIECDFNLQVFHMFPKVKKKLQINIRNCNNNYTDLNSY